MTISSGVTSHGAVRNVFDDFLEAYPDYAQTSALDELRLREFSRLDEQQHIYLDYTGAALYPRCLARDHVALLEQFVLGNPHSQNRASLIATRLVDGVRRDVLRYFNADPAEYSVIFTANASAALKLVGEGYPFAPGGQLLLTADNHNSVNGIREFARHRGASVSYVPPATDDLRIHDIEPYLLTGHPAQGQLFAYPAQSNFSGVRHPLDWVDQAHAHGYDVLLDAAAFVPTQRLDLDSVRADFVAVSFYKLFGYPTGVGALLARRGALAKLRRPWFAGGTVRLVSTLVDHHVMEVEEAAFEDGTVNYLNLPAVSAGLIYMEELGLELIHRRVTALLAYLLREMSALRHDNGQAVVRIYGPADTERRGATVAFNILDRRGVLLPHQKVEMLANQANISVRSGCFCNPGASEFALGHSHADIQACRLEAGVDGFDMRHYTACMGDRGMGAVRVSLGMASNFADVHQFVTFIGDTYLN
jgi:selenocysteine lyase/cysteine desulfurase